MRKRSQCNSTTVSWANRGWYEPSHTSDFAEESKPSSYLGTNNASSSTSREILNKLLNLKSIAKDNPDCDVWLSTSIMRTDRGKEALTVSHLTNHLLQMEINITDNRNITGKHLSRRGLHLNVFGCNQLARKFLVKIKTFWEGKGCSCTADNNRREYLMLSVLHLAKTLIIKKVVTLISKNKLNKKQTFFSCISDW